MFCFVWHSESLSTFNSVFRAITHQYQCLELSSSYFQFQRSEPSLLLLSLIFRVVFSSGVQSHYIIHSDVRSHVLLRLVFRAIVHFRFGVQSHHSSVSVLRSYPRRIFSFDVQSHHYHSSVWRSEPSSLPSLTFRFASPISAFRAIITPQFDV